MDIVSLTPLATSSLLWRLRASTWVLTVVCKATFRLEPGQATLLPQQDPVIDVDEFWDDDEQRSLRFASELVPTKPRSEWVPEQAPVVSAATSDAKAEGQAKPGARAADPRDAVLLVWFDVTSARRFRRHKPFREALDEAEKESGSPDLDDAPLGDSAADVEDRRDVLAILTRALSTDAPGVIDAMERSVSEHGVVVPPLALCAGELTIPFDVVETLQTTVATRTPLSATDENLKAALQSAREILGLSHLQSAPAVAESTNRRVLEAFGRSKRAVTVESIEAQTERALLERRAYQRRKVFGGKHLRGMLTMPGAKEPIPTYLPELLAEQLPLFTRLRVRLIAEVRVAEDQYEPHPAALRVLALGRVLERGRRER